MNDEQFDNELSTLYQQRKSQLLVPEVVLSPQPKKAKHSLYKICSIASIGTIASFSIFAIITHLTATTVDTQSLAHTPREVIIVELPKADTSIKNQILNTNLPLKPKKFTIEAAKEKSRVIKEQSNEALIDTSLLDIETVIDFLPVAKPQLSIQPIYKVMPSYIYRPNSRKQTGVVRLSYEIDELGHVVNIKVIESSVNQALQLSAKKALAKWKYNPKDDTQAHYHIVFEFKLTPS